MTPTKRTSPTISRRMTVCPSRPVGLEELISPLAEVMAAHDDPHATLGEIVAMLVSQWRKIGVEARNCLGDAAL